MPKKKVTPANTIAANANALLKKLEQEKAKKEGKTPPHLFIVARAGTGKTTTLVEGLKKLKGLTPSITPSVQQEAIWESLLLSKTAGTVCFVAFNKSIADELTRRVPQGCDAMTMHSMGLRAVKKAFPILNNMKNRAINQYRVDDLIADLLHDDIRNIRRTSPVLVTATKELVSLVKMTLCEPTSENLGELAATYEIDLNGSMSKVFDLVPQVIDRCKDVNRDGCVDFSDMIWLPVALNLPVFRYDLLLVDEAQDLNRCQQELAKRAGNRLILCGDPKQAIYGFAGADSRSMSRMQEEFGENTQELPLTVTRRCGKAIVKEAQQFVKDFEAHESNGEGKISKAQYPIKHTQNAAGEQTKQEVPESDTYIPLVQPGDHIICRVNAPLVSQCFKFIRKGKKANIMGRDVGQGLVSLINKLNADTIKSLSEKLEAWAEKEVKKEQEKKNPNENRILMILDRVDCINAFIEDTETVSEVINKIQNVFTDDKDIPGIRLSSIHKAKGLEARRVFFLQPKGGECPHPMAKTATAKEQEYNLRYVGITRAIEELVYVS